MTVDLLREDRPDYFTREELYDPINNPTGTGTKHPQVGSLVLDGSVLKRVAAVAENYAIDLEPVFMDDDSSRIILSNYGNDLFCLFVDPRKQPYTASVSTRLSVMGEAPYGFTLTRYPGTENEKVISQYYDSTNKFVSTTVPLVSAGTNVWAFQSCVVTDSIGKNEEVRLDVFNKTGSQTDSVILYGRQATIINETLSYQPKITGISLKCIQTLPNGNFYIYQKQDFSDLAITAELTYADGTTRDVQLDNTKCRLFGDTDFISSFIGMSQDITVIYYTTSDEAVSADLNDVGNGISVSKTVQVVPASVVPTFKISAIPVWTPSLAAYVLRYYYYTTDHTTVKDITAYVTQGGAAFSGNSYGTWQVLTLTVDMNDVDPTLYQTSATYQQIVCIRLQPPTVYDRYLIRDNMSSTAVYGVDATSNRRPILRYDATRGQYFVPSDIFTSQAAFLKSFYTNATPPFDPNTTSGPVTPTHFTLRNVQSGAQILATPIPLDQYTEAFSILNDSSGGYVNGVVIVEFLSITDASTTNILYGAPVDVSTGTYLGT